MEHDWRGNPNFHQRPTCQANPMACLPRKPNTSPPIFSSVFRVGTTRHWMARISICFLLPSNHNPWQPEALCDVVGLKCLMKTLSRQNLHKQPKPEVFHRRAAADQMGQWYPQMPEARPLTVVLTPSYPERRRHALHVM